MIVDSHLHLQDDVYVGPEGTPENIVALMDETGIDRAVVLRIWTSTRSSIEAAAGAAERYPDRLIPYVSAVPNFEEAVLRDVEDAVTRRAFRGIKLHAGECALHGYTVDPVLRLAEAHRVPCLIDFCGDIRAAERIAASFPEVAVIVAHLGGYLCEDETLMDGFIGLAEQHRNLYMDTSGVIRPNMIVDAVRRIGSERVLWGTDGPANDPDPAAFVRKELDKIEALGFSTEQRDNILAGTVLNLLGI